MAGHKMCSIKGCVKTASQRGWCHMHYMRWYRNGDPLTGADTRTPSGVAERFFRETVISFSGDQCLIWPFNRAGDGYGRLRLGRRHERVPRLVCEAVYGPPPTPQHEAAHSCGNGHAGCCNPGHLRWATHTENMADRSRHGSLSREKNGRSKLTEAKVCQIRSLSGKHTQNAIASMFGVSQATIQRVLSGANWTK